MFFVGLRTTANLAFTTPPECCCNCGEKHGLEFIDTPLQRTRYFGVVGTELTLTESFPYCRRCKGSASRIKLGWPGKFLVTCLLTSLLFLIMVFTAESLPAAVSSHLFGSALISALVLSLGYFLLRERKGQRSYYQPVRLLDAKLNGHSLSQVTLEFANASYARIFEKANADMLKAGMLRVETKQSP